MNQSTAIENSVSTDNSKLITIDQTNAASTVQIQYRNGDGESCQVELSWHENLGLANLSFCRQATNELIFAEDFDLETAIELRDKLSGLIANKP